MKLSVEKHKSLRSVERFHLNCSFTKCNGIHSSFPTAFCSSSFHRTRWKLTEVLRPNGRFLSACSLHRYRCQSSSCTSCLARSSCPSGCEASPPNGGFIQLCSVISLTMFTRFIRITMLILLQATPAIGATDVAHGVANAQPAVPTQVG